MSLEDLKSNLKKVEERRIGRVVCLDKIKAFIHQAEQYGQPEQFVSYQFDSEVINERITSQKEVFKRNLDEERLFRLSTPYKLTGIDPDYDFGLQVISKDGTDNIIYKVYPDEAETLKQEYIEKVSPSLPLFTQLKKEQTLVIPEKLSNALRTYHENKNELSRSEAHCLMSEFKLNLEEETHSSNHKESAGFPSFVYNNHINSEGYEQELLKEIQASGIERNQPSGQAIREVHTVIRKSPDGFEKELLEKIQASEIDKLQHSDESIRRSPRVIRKSPETGSKQINPSRSRENSNPRSKRTGLAGIGTSIVRSVQIDSLPQSHDYLEATKLNPVISQDRTLGILGKTSMTDGTSSSGENYRINIEKNNLGSMNQDINGRISDSLTIEVEFPELREVKTSESSQEVENMKMGYRLSDYTKPANKSLRISDLKESLKPSVYMKPKANKSKPKPEKPKKLVAIYPNLPITTQKDLTSAYGTLVNPKAKTQKTNRKAVSNLSTPRPVLNSRLNTRSNAFSLTKQ